jgi:hypothetical protein
MKLSSRLDLEKKRVIASFLFYSSPKYVKFSKNQIILSFKNNYLFKKSKSIEIALFVWDSS